LKTTGVEAVVGVEKVAVPGPERRLQV